MSDIKIVRELDWYDSLSTVDCVKCLNKAKIFAGHVNLDIKKIFAGFCSMECYEDLQSDDKGCFGEWKLEYGLQYYDLRKE